MDTQLADVPEEVQAFAKLRILDTIAGLVAGSQSESSRIVVRYVEKLASRNEARVLCTSVRAAAAYAAFANGVMAHAAEYDENFVSPDGAQGQHLSSCVLPAALALAEARARSGAALLLAWVLGYEIGARLSMVSTATVGGARLGYHPSLVAVFGAGTAASKMLGLDLGRSRHAMGIVGSEAAGLRKQGGSHAKAFHLGQAARNGVIAAELAAMGFTAEASILDYEAGTSHDQFGFFETHFGSGNYDLGQATDGLGRDWMLRYTVTKLRPGAIRTVSPDVALAMVSEYDIRPEQIERVDVGVTSLQNLRPILQYPETREQAVFSVWYSVAIAILDRRVGLAQFQNGRHARSDVRPMLERIRFSVDPERERDYQTGLDRFGASARVTFVLKDGRTLTRTGLTRRGFLDDPASWNDIVDKLRECVALGHGANLKIDANHIVSCVELLDELPRAEALAAALGGPS